MIQNPIEHITPKVEDCNMEKEKKLKNINEIIINTFLLISSVNTFLLIFCSFKNNFENDINNNDYQYNQEKKNKPHKTSLYFMTFISLLSSVSLLLSQVQKYIQNYFPNIFMFKTFLNTNNMNSMNNLYFSKIHNFLHDYKSKNTFTFFQFFVFFLLHQCSFITEIIFKSQSTNTNFILFYIIVLIEFIFHYLIFFMLSNNTIIDRIINSNGSNSNGNSEQNSNNNSDDFTALKNSFFLILLNGLSFFSIFDIPTKFFFHSLINTISVMITAYFNDLYINLKSESERKMREEKTNYENLLEKSKLEIRAKSLYLAKSAHEFKNIIISIINQCNQKLSSTLKIVSSSESEIDDEKRHFSRGKSSRTGCANSESSCFISSLCNYLLILIEDLNTFTKIEGSTNNPSPLLSSDVSRIKKSLLMDVELIPTLEFCVNIFRSRQKFDSMKKNIKILFKYECGRTKKIIANEIKLKQVVINLLSNAYKFTLSGEIRLSATIMEDEGKKFIRIAVSDTGIGIADSEKDTLFNPFKIIERNQRYNTNGSGLGLSIVRELVGQMDSKLEFISEMCKGSVFWFDIPERQIYSRFSSSQLSLYSKPREMLSNSNVNDTVIFDTNLVFTESQKNIIYDLNLAFDNSSSNMNNINMLNFNGLNMNRFTNANSNNANANRNLNISTFNDQGTSHIIPEQTFNEEFSPINSKHNYKKVNTQPFFKFSKEKHSHKNLNEEILTRLSSRKVIPKSKFSNLDNRQYNNKNYISKSSETNILNIDGQDKERNINIAKNKVNSYILNPNYEIVSNSSKGGPKSKISKSSLFSNKEELISNKPNMDTQCNGSCYEESPCRTAIKPNKDTCNKDTCKDNINLNINLNHNFNLNNSFYNICRKLSSPKIIAESRYPTKNELQLRVMICDDDENISKYSGKLIKKICKKKNIYLTIVTCNNGIECLYTIYQEFINRKYFDIIFIDETMPFIKGSLATKVIKNMVSDRQINNLLVYAVTAYEDKEILRNISQNGCDGILHKPISKSVVDKIIEVHFKKE